MEVREDGPPPFFSLARSLPPPLPLALFLRMSFFSFLYTNIFFFLFFVFPCLITPAAAPLLR